MSGFAVLRFSFSFLYAPWVHTFAGRTQWTPDQGSSVSAWFFVDSPSLRESYAMVASALPVFFRPIDAASYGREIFFYFATISHELPYPAPFPLTSEQLNPLDPPFFREVVVFALDPSPLPPSFPQPSFCSGRFVLSFYFDGVSLSLRSIRRVRSGDLPSLCDEVFSAVDMH